VAAVCAAAAGVCWHDSRRRSLIGITYTSNPGLLVAAVVLGALVVALLIGAAADHWASPGR
jgi:hypothetical protein